jgi:hypothetical protein
MGKSIILTGGIGHSGIFAATLNSGTPKVLVSIAEQSGLFMYDTAALLL